MTGSLRQLGVMLLAVSLAFAGLCLFVRRLDRFKIRGMPIVFYRSENPAQFQQLEKTAGAIAIASLALGLTILALQP